MNSEDATKNVEYYLSLPYTIILRPDEDGDVIARVEELSGCLAHGVDDKEALHNLRGVQKAWIQECLDSGQPVPVPVPEEELPSGKFIVRVPRTIHKKLSEMAKKECVSLNALVTSLLSDALAVKSTVDQFKVWIGEAGIPFSFHGIAPLEDVWHSRFAETWTENLPQNKPINLLYGLDVTRRLITSHEESTDAYDPQKELIGHKKEGAFTVRR